jgi:hypothetical protein
MTTDVKSEPGHTVAFESRVTRDKTGTTVVFMKSPIIEDVFSAMAVGKTATYQFRNGAVALHDSTTGAAAAFTRNPKVYTSDSIRFAADLSKMYWTEEPMYDGGPTITALSVVGLRHGISWRIEQPMTVDALKKYAERLRTGVKLILESVRPVEISMNLAIGKKAA